MSVCLSVCLSLCPWLWFFPAGVTSVQTSKLLRVVIEAKSLNDVSAGRCVCVCVCVWKHVWEEARTCALRCFLQCVCVYCNIKQCLGFLLSQSQFWFWGENWVWLFSLFSFSLIPTQLVIFHFFKAFCCRLLTNVCKQSPDEHVSKGHWFMHQSDHSSLSEGGLRTTKAQSLLIVIIKLITFS